jgi:cation diffusion facilitator family transporter
LESLGDIFSSLIVWGGLIISSRPADEDHPYGHGKAEPLAALAVATTLLLAAGGVAWQAVREMRTPHSPPAPYTLVVLIVVVITKEAMFRYAARTGRRIDSSAVTLDAWHHRSDAITSAAAPVGISLALIGGPHWIYADEWAALLACLVIAINGLRFVRRSIHELMDTSPGESPVRAIESAAMEVDGAKFVEKTLVRKMGPALYVDLHLEVDAAMSVREAHTIAHSVKDRIMLRCPAVADVLVHVEPHIR